MHTHHLTGHFVALVAILLPLALADQRVRGSLTTAAPFLRRQIGECENPTETVCPDGDGCCAVGETCTVRSGVGLCAAYCKPGVVTCNWGGVQACCRELGSTCDGKSPGFCSATNGPFPTSSFPQPITVPSVTLTLDLPTPLPTRTTKTAVDTSTPTTSTDAETETETSTGGGTKTTKTATTGPATTSATTSRAPTSTVVVGSGGSNFRVGVGAVALAAGLAAGLLFV